MVDFLVDVGIILLVPVVIFVMLQVTGILFNDNGGNDDV